MRYQLFRVRMTAPSQRDMFKKAPDRPTVLRSILELRPSGEFRTGSVWHIGNVEALDSNSIYFAVGRTARTTWELFD